MATGVMTELAGRVLTAAHAIERVYQRHAAAVLIVVAEHPDADIREQAAVALSYAATGQYDGPEIRTLIKLTRDEDPRVRDSATFALGFQVEADSPAIRAALWERTGDSDADAREEGVHGLARRHDPRAVPLLMDLLGNADGAHVLTFHAARIMGVPELLPALLEYEPDGTGVTEAVQACDPAHQARLCAAAWEAVCMLNELRPDLGVSVYTERFDYGLHLCFDNGADSGSYSFEALLKRAGDDPVQVGELVSADTPSRPGHGGRLADPARFTSD